MSSKREVLKVFKLLHKTRKTVFDGDERALSLARQKINEEFKNNKDLNSEDKIKQLIEYTKQIEKELRTTVIQAREVAPGKYEAVLRPDTVKLDNVPFQDCEEGKKCNNK